METLAEKVRRLRRAKEIADKTDFETLIWAAFYVATEVEMARLQSIFVGEFDRFRSAITLNESPEGPS